MAQRVLVIDDEEALLEMITYALKEAGYQVKTATNVSDGARLLKDWQPGLLILDVMLPDGSGLELCKEVRSSSDVPIIILSARSEEIDRILGLELGADDYVTKPFSPRELVSRVKAQFRRQDADAHRRGNVLTMRDLKIDLESHQAFVKKKALQLTNSEFQILALLARNPGKVFSRTAILNYLWDGGFVGDERTVDVHIHNLREKLEPDTQKPTYLLTVRGLGYRLADE